MGNKKRVFLFLAVQILFHLGANFAHPVTPTFFSSLKLNDYMFGVAFASMQCVSFMFSPFWGRLNDFISSRKGLLIGGLGYALGQYFFSIAQTELQVVGARMFAGFFVSGAFVSILTYIVNTNPDTVKRGYYLAAAATIQAICSTFGFFIGGLLGEISINLVFIAQVITLAGCGVLFFFVCEDDTKISLNNIKIGTLVKESNPFSAFLESRRFMTLLLFSIFVMVVLQNIGNIAMDQSFNYFLKDQLNFSSGYNGAIKGAMGLITLVANATVTVWIINKTDVNRSNIWVFLALSLSAVVVILTPSLPVPFIAANVISYAFFAVSLPLLQGMAAKSASGESSNLVMGFYNSMKSFGGIIGALIAGVLYNMNPMLPFYFGFISYFSAFIIAIFYFRRLMGKK
jgi:DHA1 family multidrug resistance protein-like MFS transporter